MSHPRKLVSVLYKKRKFADKEQTDRQTDVSKTEVHSIPLWILSGYTRELANNRGDSTTERRMRRRKMRKFADKEQTDRHTDVSKTEVHSIPLWILSGYTRELANMSPIFQTSIAFSNH